jgi:hypothetical protein
MPPVNNSFGQDFSQFLNMPPQPGDPFPNPVNEAQRVANARSRAARAGVNVGPGRIGEDGVLRDPNEEPWYLDPRIMGPAVVGAGSVVGALAGPAAAGGAASGVLPSSSLPASMTMNAVPPAIASQGVSAAVPLGGMAAGAGAAGAAAGGAATGAGQSIARRAANGLTSDTGITALAGLLPMLMAGAANNGYDRGMPDSPYSDQLGQLLNMTTQRAQRTDPLHQMVTRLAESRMPTNMRG